MRYGFYFVATSIAVAASFALIGGVATGVIALATAELLIRRARMGRSGVDAALWLGGLIAFIAALPSHGQPEAWLAIAAAAAVAGWRVRNPWIGAAAVVLGLIYLHEKHVDARVAAVIAQAIALAAALARARTWRLQSTDRLFGAMAIAAPLTQFRDVWPIDLAGGAAMLAVAIRLRDRMLFAAAAVSIGIGAADFGHHVDYPVEWELIAAGIALVVVAVLITRALRGRTSGFVLAEGPKAHYEEAATMLVGLTTPAGRVGEPAPRSQFSGGGGDGGGAGATDSY